VNEHAVAYPQQTRMAPSQQKKKKEKRKVGRFFFVLPPPSLGVVLLDFFKSRFFGCFVTRGVQKREKKSRKCFRSRQKKYLQILTRVTFFPLLSTAPLAKPIASAHF
jgi:hypothetical protein